MVSPFALSSSRKSLQHEMRYEHIRSYYKIRHVAQIKPRLGMSGSRPCDANSGTTGLMDGKRRRRGDRVESDRRGTSRRWSSLIRSSSHRANRQASSRRADPKAEAMSRLCSRSTASTRGILFTRCRAFRLRLSIALARRISRSQLGRRRPR